jgi:hypothetical protein
MRSNWIPPNRERALAMAFAAFVAALIVAAVLILTQ